MTQGQVLKRERVAFFGSLKGALRLAAEFVERVGEKNIQYVIPVKLQATWHIDILYYTSPDEEE